MHINCHCLRATSVPHYGATQVTEVAKSKTLLGLMGSCIIIYFFYTVVFQWFSVNTYFTELFKKLSEVKKITRPIFEELIVLPIFFFIKHFLATCLQISLGHKKPMAVGLGLEYCRVHIFSPLCWRIILTSNSVRKSYQGTFHQGGQLTRYRYRQIGG